MPSRENGRVRPVVGATVLGEIEPQNSDVEVHEGVEVVDEHLDPK
jgi:hypothetical protein